MDCIELNSLRGPIELVNRALDSRYPYATLFTPDEYEMRKFLCFYGILLSESKQDLLMVIKKIDKSQVQFICR